LGRIISKSPLLNEEFYLNKNVIWAKDKQTEQERIAARESWNKGFSTALVSSLIVAALLKVASFIFGFPL
jgi:hypothetical protein